MKRFICLLLCGVLLFSLVGCKAKDPTFEEDPNQSSSEIVEEPKKPMNPLTGVRDLEEGEQYLRPMAVVINNIKVAQTVQTGLTKADIVYETEAEGGITRLVAIYQNTDGIERIGAIRSARCAFIDIALGHNAVFVHHGQEPNYALEQLKSVDHYVVGENNIGMRVNNGLAWEHRLFASGDKMREAVKNAGIKTELETVTNWQNFAEEEEKIELDGQALSVTVPFSNSYTTVMRYDQASGKYVKYYKDAVVKDAVTNENLSFKNVFVLTTTIEPLYSAYQKIYLNSGDGYYFVNGTYTAIKWTKGGSNGSFKFTKADGTSLTVNAGTSYVCISDKNKSAPIIEFPPTPEVSSSASTQG